jgi:hypothetical protein
MNLLSANSLVWPLCFVLVALFVLQRLRESLEPITSGVVKGLSVHAQRYAFSYALVCLYASAASLQALADEATKLGWLYVAAAAKIIQPGAVAVIAFVTKPPTKGEAVQ